MKNISTIKKILLASIGFVLLIGLIKLFSFSTNQSGEDAIYQNYVGQYYKVFSLNIPKNLNFAGEKVPIEDFDVRERLDRELLVNTYWQSQSILMHKRANRWFPVVEPILKRNGIPDDFKYLALIESGFTNVVSPAGATGFWQLMDEAGKSYGLEINKEIDERYNVEKSTEAACKYLRDAFKKYNNWTMAAASYNAGMNGIARQIDKQKSNNYYELLLNEETARYLFRILSLKEIITNPKQYGFHIRKQDLYPPLPAYTIKVDTTITDLVDFACKNNTNYRLLKILNPWIKQNYLPIKNGKSYQIKLPKENCNAVYDSFVSETAFKDSIGYFIGTDINKLTTSKDSFFVK